MDKYLLAPDIATPQDVVDTYNSVIKWIVPDDNRIDIAKAVLEYMSTNSALRNIFSDIYIALSDIAFIKKDYNTCLKYITQVIASQPFHHDANVRLSDTIQLVTDMKQYINILSILKTDAPNYDKNIIWMFEYACLYKNHEVAYTLLKYFSLDSIRIFYENTHGLIIPYTRAAEFENFQKFMKSVQFVLDNPKEITEFFASKPSLMLQKIGFHLAYTPHHCIQIPQLLSRLYCTIFPFIMYSSPNSTLAVSKVHRKKRIGFISSFLRKSHTIGKMFGGLLEAIDRNQFEIYIYKVDDNSDCFRDNADFFAILNFRGGIEESVSFFQKRIEYDDLDVLVYPEIGMNGVVYYMSFARLARTQIVWWGHPESPCTNIDYFISSKYFNDNQGQYDEKLLKLDALPLVYHKEIEKPDLTKTRVDLNLPNGVLYLCYQTFFKYSHDFDDALKMILENDPNAFILIVDALEIPYYINMLVKRWGEFMDTELMSRIVFIQRQDSLGKLLTLVQLVDIVLDTFPFSGSTTHMQCFSIGKPVVTLCGNDLRGSLCTGLYRRLGIQNAPIAYSISEYVDIAVRYANDKELTTCIKNQLLSAMDEFYDSEHEKRVWNELLMKIHLT